MASSPSHAQPLPLFAGCIFLVLGVALFLDNLGIIGLRSGDFNSSHVPSYYQINAGISHEYQVPWGKPFTLRLDVLNVLDQVYELRDGSGIGVFAPQFGPRRTYLVGLSQKI